MQERTPPNPKAQAHCTMSGCRNLRQIQMTRCRDHRWLDEQITR